MNLKTTEFKNYSIKTTEFYLGNRTYTFLFRSRVSLVDAGRKLHSEKLFAIILPSAFAYVSKIIHASETIAAGGGLTL